MHLNSVVRYSSLLSQASFAGKMIQKVLEKKTSKKNCKWYYNKILKGISVGDIETCGRDLAKFQVSQLQGEIVVITFCSLTMCKATWLIYLTSSGSASSVRWLLENGPFPFEIKGVCNLAGYPLFFLKKADRDASD